MKTKKFSLNELKVKSFTTTISTNKVNTVKGGHACGTFQICGDTNVNCTVRTCLGEAL